MKKRAMKKVFVVTVQETDELCTKFECFESLEKAKRFIFDCIAHFSYCRKVNETNICNVFEVTDENGNHLHNLEVVSLYVH